MDVLDRFGKWVQLKVYQVEVTYSVYMFTPAEKFIFCAFFFPQLATASSPANPTTKGPSSSSSTPSP